MMGVAMKGDPGDDCGRFVDADDRPGCRAVVTMLIVVNVPVGVSAAVADAIAPRTDADAVLLPIDCRRDNNSSFFFSFSWGISVLPILRIGVISFDVNSAYRLSLIGGGD